MASGDDFKRVQPEDSLASSAASTALTSTGVPEELAARLRLLGSRIRKNVTEGYTSVPPSMASTYGRSASTGHIFRSANDTLRDIFASPALPQPGLAATPVRKRARSFSQAETEQAESEDNESKHEVEADNSTKKEEPASAHHPGTHSSGRSFKPLPRTLSGRSIMVTQSLPAGALRFGEKHGEANSVVAIVEEHPAEEEEEDWSADTQTSSFQPTLL